MEIGLEKIILSLYQNYIVKGCKQNLGLRKNDLIMDLPVSLNLMRNCCKNKSG